MASPVPTSPKCMTCPGDAIAPGPTTSRAGLLVLAEDAVLGDVALLAARAPDAALRVLVAVEAILEIHVLQSAAAAGACGHVARHAAVIRAGVRVLAVLEFLGI